MNHWKVLRFNWLTLYLSQYFVKDCSNVGFCKWPLCQSPVHFISQHFPLSIPCSDKHTAKNSAITGRDVLWANILECSRDFLQESCNRYCANQSFTLNTQVECGDLCSKDGPAFTLNERVTNLADITVIVQSFLE